MKNHQIICVLGLGYVGLPLALALSRHYPVCGVDVNSDRIKELSSGVDITGEVTSAELSRSNLNFQETIPVTNQTVVYIVTVPTPVNNANTPDLTAIMSATKSVGLRLKARDVVVYESTVFPGCTEEECVPILESVSGLKFVKDFGVAYSPERINPGDKVNKLEVITKVLGASDAITLEKCKAIYESIITAGVYVTESIKIAEAAKIIENTQRDVNIAFMNELSIVFDRMDIDFTKVLAAAATKWNFLDFKPGLVGGHCIGVDPYYLLESTAKMGYLPDIISSSRKVNESMPRLVADNIVKKSIQKGIDLPKARFLFLGITFKENCPDIRNSKSVELLYNLLDYGFEIDVVDPWVSSQDRALRENKSVLDAIPSDTMYSGIIISVPHKIFQLEKYIDLDTQLSPGGVFVDLKNAFPDVKSDYRL
jgi:UDP-N-acetyl-D-glucosamine/UDP-N-acetyl-D-galactosamine dehydrogenase